MPVTKWTVGFAGGGSITLDNASELLDNQLLPRPEEAEILALLPAVIPRSHKGLRIISDLLTHEFDIPIETTSELVPRLLKANAKGEHAVLVVLGAESDDNTTELASEALEAELIVKDLCAALDDVELKDEGRGREEPVTVQADVAGPATIIPQNVNVSSAVNLLKQAIHVPSTRSCRKCIQEHTHTLKYLARSDR